MAFGISAATWIAGAATLGSAAINSRSAKKANQAQADSGREANAMTLEAQREAQAFQQKQIDQARADNADWMTAGRGAVNQLASRLRPDGDLVRNFSMADFQQDPGYEFRQAEGMRGLNNSAAARGNLLSGAALKAASRYNQNFASNEFGSAYGRFKGNQDSQYNKLANLAGIGQVASTQNGQNALQFGQNVGNALMDGAAVMGRNITGAGNARASGYVAQASTWGNALTQGASLWNQRNGEKPPAYGTPNASNVMPTGGY